MSGIVHLGERNVQIELNLTQPLTGQERLLALLKGKNPLRIRESNIGGQWVKRLFFGRRYLERDGTLEKLLEVDREEQKVVVIARYLWNTVHNWSRGKFSELTDGEIREVARKMYSEYGDALVDEGFGGRYHAKELLRMKASDALNGWKLSKKEARKWKKWKK